MKRGEDTRTLILEQSVKFLSEGGPGLVSLRRIGQGSGIVQSAVYHHFTNKNELLEATFAYAGRTLGLRRADVPQVLSTREFLIQRIEFQFDNADLIVALLKYFVYRRHTFPETTGGGYVPPQAYQHIVEVIERGNTAGDWDIKDVTTDAKVVVHAINGFILEYYPSMPSQEHRKVLIESIANFVWRALAK